MVVHLLLCRNLTGNLLEGPLPESWGEDTAFTQLNTLSLANNTLGGTLPPEWGLMGGFPRLVVGVNGHTATSPVNPCYLAACVNARTAHKACSLWVTKV